MSHRGGQISAFQKYLCKKIFIPQAVYYLSYFFSNNTLPYCRHIFLLFEAKKQSFCSLYLLILSKAHKFLILPLVLSIQNTWIWFAYHLFLVFQKLIYCSIDLFWKCNCFSFKYPLSSSMELCKNSSKIHVLFEL